MRFLGNIEAKTDAKGRAFLPAVFRKVLQASSEECLVLRKDVFQKCLVLYPEKIWNEQAIGADNTVAVHIRHIREKIQKNGQLFFIVI